jgi:predicted O-linked N-acetylglucosamine transferase (SPINDLY family)
MNIQQEIQKALEHYQSGDLHQAKHICKKILKKEPNNGEALYFMGVIYSQLGNHDLAIQTIRKSLQSYPNNPDAYHLLGMSLQELGQLDEAVEYYQKTLQYNPNYAEAYNNLGNICKEKKQFDEAIGYYHHAVELKPDLATAYFNLGVIYQEKKDYAQAISFYKNALQFDPVNHNMQSMLGGVLYTKGQTEGDVFSLQESENVFRQIVDVHPSDFHAWCNLGSALKLQGKMDEAMVGYRKAIELKPDFPDAHYNLALVLQETGLVDEAIQHYEKAIELDPHYSETYNNLGVLFQEKSKFDDALGYFQKALAFDNNPARALNNLGNISSEMGQIDEAESHYRRLLQMSPYLSYTHSNLLLTMNYNPLHDMDVLFSEHLRFAKQHADPLLLSCLYENERQVHRRLRIGYVSPDFRRHSVAYFIEPVLSAHNRRFFEIFCYSAVERKDGVTERIQKLSDHWREISGLADETVSTLVREDRIDILIDLAGHSGHNRLLVFARKPAPVQVTWIGYPSTTGLATIDYKIVDRYTDPPGTTEKYYTENLVRLPDCFLCYMPEKDAPGVNELPALNNGHITFGSFNNFAKVSHEILFLWAQILVKLPGARLIIKAKGLSSAAVRTTVSDFFQRQGIDAGRIELFSWMPSVSGHLERYNRVDIALDTFPYNGTTTTCEALSMGVPVVTLSGETYASRVGVSLLSNTGLTELIARSPEEYVEIALRLASDTAGLANLRLRLRDMVSRSPLTDAKRFSENLEKAYREMWTEWCGKE